MTLHLHPEHVPGCYRCDLSRHEAETIAAEQVAWWSRQVIARRAKRLRTHLKEDR